MREVVLRVPASDVEDVLDRLLPIVPGGVRESPVALIAALRFVERVTVQVSAQAIMRQAPAA